MKLVPLLLGVSIALNVAAVAWVTHDRGASAASLAASRASVAVPKAMTNPEAASDAAADRASTPWESLRSDDLPSLVQRLRREGYPPHILRAIVQAEVRERFSARRSELLASSPKRNYWEGGRMLPFDPKVMSGWRQIDREQREMIRELLGEDGRSEDALGDHFAELRYGTLPPAKREAMERVSSDYSDLRNEIYVAANGMLLPEDREKLAFLEREERADLQAVLSPEELHEYELRTSNTANQLRNQLTLFQPTEAEYRAIFAVAQRVGLGSSGAAPGSYLEQQKQLAATLKTELAGQLSADRLALLEQSLDPNYNQVNRIVARLGLPATAAREVVTVQQDVTQRAGAIRSNRDLTPTARAEQLAALETEATTRLTQTLGPNGLEAYKGSSGGWLRSLAPRPPNPTPATP